MKKMLLRKAAIALFAQISADCTPKTCSSTAADIALLKVPGPRLSFQSCLRIRLRLDLLQLHQLFFDLASSRTLLRCSRDRTSWREETVKGASEAAGKYAKLELMDTSDRVIRGEKDCLILERHTRQRPGYQERESRRQKYRSCKTHIGPPFFYLFQRSPPPMSSSVAYLCSQYPGCPKA